MAGRGRCLRSAVGEVVATRLPKVPLTCCFLVELRGFEPPRFAAEIASEMHFVDSSVVTRGRPCPWVIRRCVTRRNSAGPWSANGYTAAAARPGSH